MGTKQGCQKTTPAGTPVATEAGQAAAAETAGRADDFQESLEAAAAKLENALEVSNGFLAVALGEALEFFLRLVGDNLPMLADWAGWKLSVAIGRIVGVAGELTGWRRCVVGRPLPAGGPEAILELVVSARARRTAPPRELLLERPLESIDTLRRQGLDARQVAMHYGWLEPGSTSEPDRRRGQAALDAKIPESEMPKTKTGRRRPDWPTGPADVSGLVGLLEHLEQSGLGIYEI